VDSGSAAGEVVLLDVGPGISTDFLDAGCGAENHGNAAGTDSGSIRAAVPDAQVTATNQETGCW